MTYVLGIETTCDETAVAIVKDGKEILSNVIASQIGLHQSYGGVYPELASRSHVDCLLPVLQESLKQASLHPSDIDLIAVAKAPGLIGSITIGLNAAKALSLAWGIPYVGVNHIEAHLYAAMMGVEEVVFPALGVVLSGGHTFIVKIHALGHYETLGTTVDDALGEAFDKVASLLGLPYPGGPEIEKLALLGNPYKYTFKAGRVKNHPLHFSFSGIKTSVLYAVKGACSDKNSPTLVAEEEKKHIAASFQEAVFTDVLGKTLCAAYKEKCNILFLGGGVTQSRSLKEYFRKYLPETVKVYYPPQGLSLDNGAMIAGLGYHVYQKNKVSDPLNLQAQPRLPL
ncbi:MAG: tRNA (adenosine(37)-N6)-threonylcarbamoyltransferase complex transferase subunit TsaD [Chlamydiae bacterium]|nr:tRNA (adenosine(37)-N6)-threonylcarbamoyltransferase complex transferase subunit TsaD [Chlamydiota bacterium]